MPCRNFASSWQVFVKNIRDKISWRYRCLDQGENYIIFMEIILSV